MKKIAFEPHLDSINKAYEDYFRDSETIDFQILKKPRWKDNSRLKIIKMIIFMIKCFFDFSTGKYDLVHLNGANFGIIAYLASFFKCKYIFTMHSSVQLDMNDDFRVKVFSKITKIFRPIIAKRAEQVFTISNFSKKNLENKYGIKLKVIYNGYQKERMYFDPSKELVDKYNLDRKILFISVGRMVEYKNPFKVIDVFEQAKKQINNAFLIFIGKGILFNKVKKYVKKKDLDRDILFIKEIPYDDIRKWYSNATYFISGCNTEDFGLAPLEAVACRCFPILPKGGAFPEIFVKDKYFYDVNKIDNIKFFKPTIEDKEYLSKVLEKYSWEKSIRQYELYYRKITGEI